MLLSHLLHDRGSLAAKSFPVRVCVPMSTSSHISHECLQLVRMSAITMACCLYHLVHLIKLIQAAPGKALQLVIVARQFAKYWGPSWK